MMPDVPKPDMGRSWRKNPGPSPAFIAAVDELLIKDFETQPYILENFGRKPRTIKSNKVEI